MATERSTSTVDRIQSATGLRVRPDLYDEDYSEDEYEQMLSMYEGTMSQIVEGEMTPFDVNGIEVIVLWPSGGTPKAFQGTCPHQDLPLKDGYFNGQILTCPAHEWVFDGCTGEGLSPTGCALRPARLCGLASPRRLGPPCKSMLLRERPNGLKHRSRRAGAPARARPSVTTAGAFL